MRLPGEIANEFGEVVYLYRGDGFVRIYPSEERERVLSALENLPDLPDENEQWLMRELGGSLSEVPVKAKGRLTLPKAFREHGGFEGGEDLVLIGCVRYAELWKSLDAYEAERKRHLERRLITG